MSHGKHFPGASYYCILEGDSRFLLEHLGSSDPLFKQRIEFKENLINDLVARVADADLKINLLLEIKEIHHEEKRKYLSAEESLESSLLDDAIQTNVLEIAEILDEFLNRLRTTIPASCHLFRKSTKILGTTSEVFQKTYILSRSFLFPEVDDAKSNGKVKDSYFHSIADRLKAIGEPILTFRNKVLAHKYDKDRFYTHLSFEEYRKIRDAFKSTLDAVAIVGTLSSNDWFMTRSPIEIKRTTQWLTEGLIAAALPIRRNGNTEPTQP